MSDRDPQVRAEDAQRLLNDALLREALDEFEKALIDRAVAAPARDDEARTRCMTGVQVLRKVRKHLENVVYDGKRAAEKAANDIAKERRWL